MSFPVEQPEESPDGLPEWLASEYSVEKSIRPATQARIFSAAAEHLAGVRTAVRREAIRLRRWRRAGIGSTVCSAAAVVLILLTAGSSFQGYAAPHIASMATRSSDVVARTDINGDRRLNILDALAVARSVRSGDSSDTSMDLNQDGQVDQADADLAAARAVTL